MATFTVDTDGVSGDYSTLDAAIADNTTLSEAVIINCQATTGVADSTNINRTITNNGHTLTIQASPGDEFEKDQGMQTSRYRYTGNARFPSSNYEIIGIQFHGAVNFGRMLYLDGQGAGSVALVDSCGFKSAAASRSNAAVLVDDTNLTAKIQNSIVLVPDNECRVGYQVDAGIMQVVNCGVAGMSQQGLSDTGATSEAINVLSFANTTNDFNNIDTVTNCGQDDSTGTNPQNPSGADWGNELTAYATDNWTALPGGNMAGNGVGPSVDADVPTTDIDGSTRSGSTCDIGADEIAVTTDALTADDLTSGTPTIDTAGIGQTHAITTTELNSGVPTIDISTIGQIHGITADDFISGIPTIDLATLSSAGVENLITDDLTADIPTIEIPGIGQIHGILSNDLLSGIPTIDSSIITQIQALLANGLTSGIPTIDQAILDADLANGLVRIVGVAKSLKMSGNSKSLKMTGTAKSLKITSTGV